MDGAAGRGTGAQKLRGVASGRMRQVQYRRGHSPREGAFDIHRVGQKRQDFLNASATEDMQGLSVAVGSTIGSSAFRIQNTCSIMPLPAASFLLRRPAGQPTLPPCTGRHGVMSRLFDPPQPLHMQIDSLGRPMRFILHGHSHRLAQVEHRGAGAPRILGGDDHDRDAVRRVWRPGRQRGVVAGQGVRLMCCGAAAMVTLAPRHRMLHPGAAHGWAAFGSTLRRTKDVQ